MINCMRSPCPLQEDQDYLEKTQRISANERAKLDPGYVEALERLAINEARKAGRPLPQARLAALENIDVRQGEALRAAVIEKATRSRDSEAAAFASTLRAEGTQGVTRAVSGVGKVIKNVSSPVWALAVIAIAAVILIR